MRLTRAHLNLALGLQRQMAAVQRVADTETGRRLGDVVMDIIAAFPSGHEFTTDDVWRRL